MIEKGLPGTTEPHADVHTLTSHKSGTKMKGRNTKNSRDSPIGRTPTPSSESAARPCPLSYNSRDCRGFDSCRSPIS